MLRLPARQLRAASLAFGVVGSLTAAGLAAMGSLGTAACGQTATGGGTGNQNPAGSPIVIGASVPTKGSLSGNATAMQGGLLAAVQQVNALGGILGRQVTVAQQSDASEPTTALTVAKSLFGMGASVLIGPTGSGQVSEIASFIQSSKFVDISSAATSTLLAGPGVNPPNEGFFFRTVPSDAYQAIAVGIFALEGPTPKDGGTGGCRKMDIMYDTDSYGQPLETAIIKYFTASAQGGTVLTAPGTGTFGVNANETSTMILGGIAAQVLLDLPDCMVMAVYPPTAAGFMEQLSQALETGTPPKWSKSFFVIGTDGVYDPSLLSAGVVSGTSYINGSVAPPLYGTVALTNDHTNQYYNDLVTIYQSEGGPQTSPTDLDPYTANQYDATVLTLLAMEAAGTSTDGAAIQKSMFNVSHGKDMSNALSVGPADLASAISTLQGGGDINYQGASGDVDFDQYGDVVANFLVWEVSSSNTFVDHSTILASKLMAAQK